MNHLILLLEKGKQLLVSHVKGNPPILYLCLLSVDDFRIEPPTFVKKLDMYLSALRKYRVGIQRRRN